MGSKAAMQYRQRAELRPVPARSHVLHRAQGFGPTAAVRQEADPAAYPTRNALASSGRPLDAATRAYMEPRFGYDFSNVRVFTDESAARSARSIDALSYTVGTDIAFASGQYSPNTLRGRQLLAHELTHVAQQSRACSDQGLTIAPSDSPAEREADAAAASVASGGALTGPVSTAGATVQRQAAGIIAAGVGVAAAAAAAEVLLSDARPLTAQEITEAKKVFGASLKYDEVRIAESTVMGFGNIARTPYNTIYLPPGTQKELSFANLMPWLIHEMTHTWQTQHGIGVMRKLMTALSKSNYAYGKEKGLTEAWAAGRHFRDFNTEQQGDICEDYYTALTSGGDTKPYEPFIAEVKNGGLPLPTGKDMTPDPTGPSKLH
jgi:hypothetical protein